jgi:hypothetical protein
VFASRTNIDISAFAVLVPKPRHGSEQRFGIPDSREHDRFVADGIWLEQADFEDVGGHGSYLPPYSLDCSIGRK